MFRRRRAERRAQAEAQRTESAVTAERQRIAREMHDIVAHSLSVIVIQADGGRYAAVHDPAAAARALATIAETGRSALADTRRILGLLRAESDAADRSPVPDSGTIADVVASVRAGGLDVLHIKTGAVRPLPPGVRLAMYRVCQESLTNVLKHAAPDAQVVITESYGDTGIRLTVHNTSGSARPSETGDGVRPVTGPPFTGETGRGHGLIGMRERAELFGGTVSAEPGAEGGFRVRLDLPYPDGHRWDDDAGPLGHLDPNLGNGRAAASRREAGNP
jgi:signal transduction histidine kinase